LVITGTSPIELIGTQAKKRRIRQMQVTMLLVVAKFAAPT